MPGLWATGLSILLALLAPRAGRAQSVSCNGTGDFPCGYQVSNLGIQPAPNILKFQARISQAKLPTGNGVFKEIIVALKRGNETLCTEELHDVSVSDSTLNLEIGRNMDCELDQVVAANQDLALQICIGGADDCLRPIPLGTTPDALKSSFAVEAVQAHSADVAGLANYAQRATADRDMTVRKELGIGYFDFSTPGSAPSLYPNASDFAPYAQGGFLTWMPMQETAPTLSIAARDPAHDTPIALSRLFLESNDTETLGRLVVKSKGVLVTGASSIDGATTIVGMLTVNPPSGSNPSLAVQGPGTFGGTLTVGGPATVVGGGLHVTGDSDEAGNLSLTGALTSGGPLTVTSGGANVTGNMTLIGNLDATGTINAPSASVDGLSVGATGATIAGPLTVNGQLVMSGAASMSGVSGDFNVPGTLTAGALKVTGGTTVPGITATGNIGAGGKDPNSGYPSGWTGGLHTKDLYAEGSIGVGPTGGAYMDNSGTVHAQSGNISGNLQVSTVNGKVPGSGSGQQVTFYWSTNCSTYMDQYWGPSSVCSCGSDTAVTFSFASVYPLHIVWQQTASSFNLQCTDPTNSDWTKNGHTCGAPAIGCMRGLLP